MKKQKKKKVKLAVAAVPILTAGAVVTVTAYQSGITFDPSGADRDLQVNQVVFSDDNNTEGKDKGKDNSESELLQKDQNADDGQGKDNQNNPAYLFENNLAAGNDENVVGVVDNERNRAQLADGKIPGQIYDVSGNGTGADTIIAGKNTTGQGAGNNNNGSQNAGGNENGGTTVTPTPTPDPGDNDDPVYTVKDPEPVKANPPMSGGVGEIPTKPYVDGIGLKEDTDENGDNASVYINQSLSYSGSILYEGQSIDAKTIFYSLETYVMGKDGTVYLWGADALDKYIRIDGVSFDGGNTWNTSFPVTIPKGLEEDMMVIRVSYRLSVNDSNWIARDVPYSPVLNRIFVLSQKIGEGDTTIDENTILNDEQHPDVGTKMNLFRWQSDFFAGEEITGLFPGWMENGKLVPWFYEATEGRHILEPADLVPLEEGYQVELQYVWMSDDYQVDPQYNNLCYLQTLTGYDTGEETYKTLEVPEYIQAIRITDYSNLHVQTLKIPDTVLYIEDTENGLVVENKYKVSEENQFYASSDDGLLLNKAETEIIGIPYKVKSLHVADTVQKIDLSTDNQIEEIHLDMESADQIPEIQYDKLGECKFVVKDNILDEFLENQYKYFYNGDNRCVASEENQGITYTVDNGMVISNTGSLRKVLDIGESTVKLSDDVSTIQSGAFISAEGVKTIVMPHDGSNINFETGCFKGSSLEEVRCHTEEQYEAVKDQIEQAGMEDEIKVELIQTSQEGIDYCLTEEDGEEKGILIDAPADLTTYDGTVTGKDGEKISIQVIDDLAFANCTELKWAFLPEETQKIGYRAFENCTALEGFLIRNKDTVTIGDQALNGCSSLRFAASNAMTGIVENGYGLFGTEEEKAGSDSYTYFYVPTNAEGYSGNCISFVEESGVEGYDVVDLGGEGKALFGINANAEPWIALRSGYIVEENLKLPSTTIEVFSYAFSDTRSEEGYYTVNWDELPMLWALDDGAFFNSELGGDISLGDDFYLLDYAFAGCTNLTSIQVPGTEVQIGRNVFQNCSSLETATFGQFLTNEDFTAGMFDYCDNLTDVTFTGNEVVNLSVYGTTGYQFNYGWSKEEEQEQLKIHVPDELKMDYVKGWRYLFAGYFALDGKTPYQEMWNDIENANINWDTGEIPSEETVNTLLEEKLLVAENRVRINIGMETVSEPTELYHYRTEDGILTLTLAPSAVEETTLTGATLEFPEGWALDYIGSNAFSRSRNLKKVTIPETLVGIYTDAFAGVESSQLTLEFEGSTAPQLLGMTPDEPFTFGVDTDRIHIQVPEGAEEAYLEAWKYPMAGYEDQAQMEEAVRAEMTDGDQEPTDEEVLAEMEKRLLPVENILRQMLGMEQVDETEGSEISDTQEPSEDDLAEENVQSEKKETVSDAEEKKETDLTEQDKQSEEMPDTEEKVEEKTDQKTTEEETEDIEKGEKELKGE